VSDNELVSYYKKCSIVLITAKYAEGFGLPIIEGYLFNRPVIASNICAIPEVIFDTSFLFENKIQSIIDKLHSVLKLQDKSYRKFYLENFGNHIIISRFDILYNSLLNN
jgi:glycosyltransferase involved in cell wall biosynthesis